MIKNLFKLTHFLASIIGALLIILTTFFFIDKTLSYTMIIGLILIEITILTTKISKQKINKIMTYAKKKGLNKNKKSEFKQAIKNKKNLSGHIARAILISFLFSRFENLLIAPTTIFCTGIILLEMNNKKLPLSKILLSTALGTLASILSVIISNLIV